MTSRIPEDDDFLQYTHTGRDYISNCTLWFVSFALLYDRMPMVADENSLGFWHTRDPYDE